MRLLCYLLLLVALSLQAGSAGAAEAGMKPLGTTLFQNVCAACHGPLGEGSELLKAPAIAGKPVWYVLRQLENFNEGRRGISPAEPQAMIMAAVVKTLTLAQRENVAAFIEGLALVAPLRAEAKDADLAVGKLLFEERCMECHRYNGSGEMTFGSPPLVGLQGWYLEAEIRKFKDGGRGALPGDAFGTKMVLSARFIESEEALRGVVAYIQSLNKTANPEGHGEALFKPPLVRSKAVR